MPNLLNAYRKSLTDYQSILAYAALGIIGGMASGVVVLAFELTIVEIAKLWQVDMAEGFEALEAWERFALPAGGALVLGLCFSFMKPEDRESGIVHVISRMHSHYSVLPWRNALVQFLGGAFALASGQSGGREGPGVHLGGAVNSLLGQKLGLPNNSLRVLIACGTAGGIAAAFNTPLAGVIFAMEVIIVEYTMIGFIPVILAAVSAAVVSRTLDSGLPTLAYSGAHFNSLWELPYIILLGICCGMAASAFIWSTRMSGKLIEWPVWVRFTLAGTATGLLGIYVPQILGMGYDTLRQILLGELAPMLLLAIALGKLATTSFSVGIGMPIGLIGPNLLIGACLGGIFGTLGQATMPELASERELYIIIAMAASMGAVMNAPLAAILAVIEMTQAANIALPALLAIVIATLTNSGVFRQRSAHQSALRMLRRSVPEDPVNQLLHRTAINACIEMSVMKVPSLPDAALLELLEKAPPHWCLIERDQSPIGLARGTQLVDWLQQQKEEGPEANLENAGLQSLSIAPLPVTATLRQALDTMRDESADACWVFERGVGGKQVLQGIVTRDAVEKYAFTLL